MRLRKWMTPMLALAVVCPLAYGYHPHVEQYAEGYQLGTDYEIWGTSPEFRIVIRTSSVPGNPYDFDCFDLDDPNDAAHIRSITAEPPDPNEPDLNIELIVRGHDGREYGATNIYALVFRTDQRVHGTLKEFTISGILGYDEDTYAETIEGPVSAGSIRAALHATSITGDFTVANLFAPLLVTTLSGDLTSDAVVHDSPITIDTISGTFVTNLIEPNSPVQIGALSGNFTAGDPSDWNSYVASPVTIDTLSGAFHANVIRSDSPMSIGALTGHFDVTANFLTDPNNPFYIFGVHSPVNVGSMTGQDASLEIGELFSQLTVGDPNDPQPQEGILSVYHVKPDSSIEIGADSEGAIFLGGAG